MRRIQFPQLFQESPIKFNEVLIQTQYHKKRGLTRAARASNPLFRDPDSRLADSVEVLIAPRRDRVVIIGQYLVKNAIPPAISEITH
jgi:hypothetical protein